MEYKSSLQIGNSQSWYFTDLDDSRLGIIPPNRDNVSVDVNNPNKIITGGGNVTDNGDILTLFEILTNTPYNETKIPPDQTKFNAQRYMMSNTDWTNFEVTLYAESVSTEPNSEISIYGRSARHVMGRAYEGTYYKVTITADGKISCNSKHWHPGGINILEPNSGSIGDIEGKRIGIKFIVYTNKDGRSAVIKCLVDTDGNNSWTQMLYVIDNGDLFGNNNSYVRYGDESTKVITWGGPIIGIEIRNYPENGIMIDKMSVREIDALSPKVIVPVPAAPIDPEAVSPPIAPPSTGLRTDILDDWDDDVVYPDPPWGDPGDP